jgi:CRP-like cAMP-binding protein
LVTHWQRDVFCLTQTRFSTTTTNERKRLKQPLLQAKESIDAVGKEANMGFEQVLLEVAHKPGSVRSRIKMAAALQHFQVPGTERIWEATALIAAARGDFFDALALIRLHLPRQVQSRLLTEIIKHYASTPLPQDPGLPHSPRPYALRPDQIPTDKRSQLNAALKLGTTLPDNVQLSTHLQLPEFPIFGDLPEALLIVLTQNMVPVPLQEGDVLLRQGTTERACYLLTHGRVRVLKEQANEAPIELAKLTAPTLIGEISLLTKVSRRATIVAASPGLAWRIDASLLEHLGRLHNTLIPQIRTLIRMRLVMNLMRSGEIFPLLEESIRYELLQAFTMHEIEPNRDIIRLHEHVPGLFLSMHGEATVEIQMGNGSMREVTKLPEGSLFGGPSFFSGQPSRTTIRMPEGGLLLQLTPQSYQTICRKYPHLDAQLRNQKYPY